MATCPRCKGHLTDTHRCPRHPVLNAAEILLVALTGAFLGLLLGALLDPREIFEMDTISAVTGAAVALGIHRVLRS
jgi:uncharacterized paraquat-inducible protein A